MSETKLFRLRDLSFVAARSASAVAALLLPRRLDRGAVAAMCALARRTRPEAVPRRAARIRRFAGSTYAEQEAERIAREAERRYWELYWVSARALARGGLQWRSRLAGLEHVRAAREGGRGCVLWCASTAS
ncbi:MAG: hypothetical protein R3190_17850, partial [Thermoanaerobaculia bacterium]|nr:hypothetical protein [Thermoanaerobaculia bacterium]